MERDSGDGKRAPQMALRSVPEHCSRLDLGTLPWPHQGAVSCRARRVRESACSGCQDEPLQSPPRDLQLPATHRGSRDTTWCSAGDSAVPVGGLASPGSGSPPRASLS